NPHPRPTVYANTNVESIPSLPIPSQDTNSQREEIDTVTSTYDVLPLGVENDDSDGEVDALRVDNSITKSEHEFSESEESYFDNPIYPSVIEVFLCWIFVLVSKIFTSFD
nr:hypothetical protein [Tanacetum cinerariifolium]